MSRMEIVIERLLALPAEQQDAFAGEIEALLEEPASQLTAAQWAEVDAELAGAGTGDLPHAMVMARMRVRFGR
jgi:hypothetical protein